jgi:glutathione S-transferase
MQLSGRSSSHFTRIPRIFAAELEVAYDFHIIRDLMSADPEDYGGNPALKLPTLRADDEIWFGSLNICRELARHSSVGLDILWPEDLASALHANAQEMTLQAMATEVGLIMGKAAGVAADNPLQAKMRSSLLGTIDWLERNATAALVTLAPERDLGYLEVSLFCLVEHLEFREVLSLDAYPALRAFGQRFAARSSAKATAFRFDFPTP